MFVYIFVIVFVFFEINIFVFFEFECVYNRLVIRRNGFGVVGEVSFVVLFEE